MEKEIFFINNKYSQDLNWEREQLLDKYPHKRLNKVKPCDIRRSKANLWKNRGLLQDRWQKVKTRVWTQTWITYKKNTTTSKNTKRNIIKILDETEKARQLELKKEFWGNLPKKKTSGRMKT